MSDKIRMVDGAGGRAMRRLIEEVFVKGLGGKPVDGIGLDAMDDGAAIRVPQDDKARWLVVTTDSHVVHPIFFPGGDIGRIAVAGTVNDLAMMGATEPLALTLGVVVEEGFARADLERIRDSIRQACDEAGATIVTGDTKVMGKGEVDGIVLNTAGVGFTKRPVRDNGLRPGDRIVVSGTVGDHGFAILAVRHQLALEGRLVSDVAPVNMMVRAALEVGGADIVALKDPTRGGLASALHEMAAKAKVGIVLDEASIPIATAVRAASEITGIDPLLVACEGKAVFGVRANMADKILAVLRAHPQGRDAAIIGTAVEERPGQVILDTGFGRRILPELEGDPLPRIC